MAKAPSKALGAPSEPQKRGNPVVSSQVCPECEECINEDRGPEGTIGRPSQSIIIRRILEGHYAGRIAEKKAPKLVGIPS